MKEILPCHTLTALKQKFSAIHVTLFHPQIWLLNWAMLNFTGISAIKYNGDLKTQIDPDNDISCSS